MNKRFLTLISLTLMAGCAAPQPSPSPVASTRPATTPASANVAASAAPTQSMKGFNLYSWLDDPSGSYYYALVPATNAEPDLARVKAAGSTDLEALLKRLQALEAGAYVFWNPRVALISSIHFMLPPQPARGRIESSSSRLKLEIDPGPPGSTP